MALRRVCDTCLTIVDDKEYVDITYHKRRGTSPLLSPISQTLCIDCFKKLFGDEQLKIMASVYDRDIEERVQQYMEGNE